MEKAGLLITRLLELYNKKAGNEQLRITAQLLLSELEKAEEKELNLQSVSVFFPAAHKSVVSSEETAVLPEAKQETSTIEKKTEQKQSPAVAQEKNDYSYFNPMIEIPTLALKQQEVNETIAAQQESLNDKLKYSSPHRDLSRSISDAPIKDLRKAIGINDQYLFINELFRGDQIMYDRSIKTINSFNIYGEAELWIKRELKLKLGWNENSEATALFDQLVKRRFA